MVNDEWIMANLSREVIREFTYDIYKYIHTTRLAHVFNMYS
jgi:hypothetical protein